MKKSVGKRALMVAAFGLMSAAPVSGARADTASEIAALKARLKQLESQVAKQNKEAKEAKAQAIHATNVANAAVVKGAPGHPVPPPVFVSFKNGLFVETEDKAYSFKIGGRILMDGGYAAQPLNGFDNQAGFRQVRLEVEGKAAAIYFYKLQYDFAGTGQITGANQTLGGIRDAYFGIQTPLLPLRHTLRNSNIVRPFLLGVLSCSCRNIGGRLTERYRLHAVLKQKYQTSDVRRIQGTTRSKQLLHGDARREATSDPILPIQNTHGVFILTREM